MSDLQQSQLSQSIGASQATTNAQCLQQNVKNLREQLNSVYALLNKTQQATTVTYEEQQDRTNSQELKDIALLNQNSQLTQQNKQLTQELQACNQTISDLTNEKTALKQQVAELQTKLDQKEQDYNLSQKQVNQLTTQVKSLQEENKNNQTTRVKAEVSLQQAQSQLTIQMQQASQEKQQLAAEIATLRSENTVLHETNQKLNEKVEEFNQFDVEATNIELQNAQKAIEQFRDIIEGLNKQIAEQKATYQQTISGLRTTIASMEQDMEEEANGVSRAELEKKIVELVDENEKLTNEIDKLNQQMTTKQSLIMNLNTVKPTIQQSQGPVDELSMIMQSRKMK